jgi:hypothetical protein
MIIHVDVIVLEEVHSIPQMVFCRGPKKMMMEGLPR